MSWRIFRSKMKAFRPLLAKQVSGRRLLNAAVIDEEKNPRGGIGWQFCLLLKSRGVLAKPTRMNICVGSVSASLHLS